MCWSLTLRMPEPWKAPSLLALKRLEYAGISTVVNAETTSRMLVSDAVDMKRMGEEEFLSQITARQKPGEPANLATLTLWQEL